MSFEFSLTSLLLLGVLVASIAQSNNRTGRRQLFPTRNWGLVDDGPDNYTARHECSFVKAGNKFFLMGGRGSENPRQIDVFDLETFRWVQENRARAPFQLNHFQALEYQGLIWVVGAFSSNTRPEEDAERIYVYDIANDVWLDGTTIPSDRRRGSGGLVIYKDSFYLVGGNNNGHAGGYVNYFDRYTPINNAWVPLRSQNAPRERDHFHAVVCQDKLYAAGGRLSGGDGGTFAPLIPEVDVYDFNSNSWSTLPPELNLPTPRAGTTALCYQDRFVVVIGGESRGQVYDDVQAFDVELQMWQNLDSLNVARHGTQAILVDDTIFLAAGSPNWAGGRTHQMEVYGNENVALAQPSTAGVLEVESVSETEVVVRHVSGTQGVYVTAITVEGDYSLGRYRNGAAVRVPTLMAIGRGRAFGVVCDSEPCRGGTFSMAHSGGQELAVTLPSTVVEVTLDAGSISNDRTDWITTTTSFTRYSLSPGEGVEPPYNTMSLARNRGTLTYTIPDLSPAGSYSVTLGWRRHLCAWHTENVQVYIEGREVENSLALPCRTSVIVASYNVVADASGSIRIDFLPVNSGNRNAFVNFIEVAEADVTIIDAGSISNDRTDWITTTTSFTQYRLSPSDGVEPPYNTMSLARNRGTLTYTIPELSPAGSYSVTLGWRRHLCAWHTENVQVYIEGREVENSLALPCRTSVIVASYNAVADASGSIRIDFLPVNSGNRNAFVNFIEVAEANMITIDAGSISNDRTDWITTTTSYTQYRLNPGEGVEPPYDTMSLARNHGTLTYTIPELSPARKYNVTLGWRRHLCAWHTENVRVYVGGTEVENSLALPCRTSVIVVSYNAFADLSGSIRIDFLPVNSGNRNAFINFIEVTTEMD